MSMRKNAMRDTDGETVLQVRITKNLLVRFRAKMSLKAKQAGLPDPTVADCVRALIRKAVEGK